MAALLSFLLFVNLFCTLVSSLYFHIGDGQQKCFIEEIPDETMIVGSYRIRQYDQQREQEPADTRNVSIFLQVKDPDDGLLLSRLCDADGSFTFTSHRPGGHHICLRPASSHVSLSSGGGALTVHLDIRVGERTNNYTKIQAEEKLTELQLRIRQLASQVEQIQKVHDYYRVQDERFREVDHNTHLLIFWWPVVRSLYVVTIIIWFTKSW